MTSTPSNHTVSKPFTEPLPISSPPPQTDTSLAQLRDMHAITLDLLNQRALPDLLQTIVERAARILDAPYAELSLLTEDGRLCVRAVTENQPEILGDIYTREVAPLGWQAFDTQTPVIVDDYGSYEHRRDLYAHQNLYAVAEIPIVVRGNSIGIIDLARDLPDKPFTPEDIERGLMFAQLVGVVLDNHLLRENAILLEVERRKSEVLAEFIRDVSHEFRTPLSIIQTSLYLLNRTTDSQIRATKSANIERQVQSIDHLITMMTLQAAVDTQSFHNNQVRMSLNALIDIASSAVREAIDEAGHRFELDMCPDDISLTVHSEYMSVALQQLLLNAVRYTPKGGHILMRARHAHGMARITVADTGVGIPPNMLQRIFARFFRLDTAHTTPGFGLGLSIASRVVEQHGGRIVVESELGLGSTFTVLLPLA
jgi:signal transduction histidine kinase